MRGPHFIARAVVWIKANRQVIAYIILSAALATALYQTRRIQSQLALEALNRQVEICEALDHHRSLLLELIGSPTPMELPPNASSDVENLARQIQRRNQELAEAAERLLVDRECAGTILDEGVEAASEVLRPPPALFLSPAPESTPVLPSITPPQESVSTSSGGTSESQPSPSPSEPPPEPDDDPTDSTEEPTEPPTEEPTEEPTGLIPPLPPLPPLPIPTPTEIPLPQTEEIQTWSTLSPEPNGVQPSQIPLALGLVPWMRSSSITSTGPMFPLLLLPSMSAAPCEACRTSTPTRGGMTSGTPSSCSTLAAPTKLEAGTGVGPTR